MQYWISLLLLTAVALSGPANAEAYKCRTADGRMEITNTPCPSGANTVKTVREEPVSEASRQQAEREVARMRDYVDKREAAQRKEETAERERQASQRQSATTNEGNNRSVDDCLRDLDQQALQPAQRAQKEAACRGNAPQPVYVPVPVYGDNPAANCIANAQRQNLSPSERQRRISQCEASYSLPSQHRPPARPAPEPEHHPAPAPAKAIGTPPAPCPPGARNCLGR